MPLSLRAWQRGWSRGRLVAAAAGCTAVQLALGLLLYAVIAPFMSATSDPFVFAVVFVLATLGLRSFRYSRIGEIRRGGPQGQWATYAVLSLMGPAETLVPILIQARQWGAGRWPFWALGLAYAAGTLITIMTLAFLGRMAWNRPRLMVRGFGARPAAWPMGLGLAAVGLAIYYKSL